MKGVEIIKLDLVKNDERGKTFEFENRNSPKIILIKRNKGTISGEHYHTNENKWKNPEYILLVDGEIEVYFKDLKTGEELRQVINEPTMIKIYPYIYHTVTALTNLIFMDMNAIKDGETGCVKGDKL